MRVLIVGSGGREHALAWKLSQSRLLDELHAAPGNPGIARLGTCHPVRADDGEDLLALAQALEIDLAVIGPEAPLVAGVADELRHAGIAVFGPTAAAAQIEGSKSFAKEVMETAGVPTAATLAAAEPPCVVKADGLAGGKGVFVCRTREELEEALRAASALPGPLVIEELLEGEELSLFVISDGRGALPLAAARDYKRAGDGDTGPNTGGMGAFSPVPEIGRDEVEDLVELVHRPVLAELARRRTPFSGLLYAGLMLTSDGPRVLEFNCRFGDPETQAIVPRIDGDLLEALAAASAGDLRRRRSAGLTACGRDRGRRGRRLPGAGRPGLADRRRRAGGSRRRSRLPRRHRAERRPARHERRPDPERDRARRRHRGRAHGCLRRRSPDLVRRRPLPDRHRPGGGQPCLSRWWACSSAPSPTASACRTRSTSSTGNGIAYEFEVRSAHRDPEAVAEYGQSARSRGLKVLICGAGLAAALPGVVAAHTDLPVIGVPLRSSKSVLDGLDALLSIVQMPPGVPVACVGVDNARNAAVLAARIIGIGAAR